MRHRLRAVIVALALGLALAPATTTPAADTIRGKLSVGGMERSYIVSAPALQGMRPTVIVLHGGTLNAENAMRTTGFAPLVDREGLIAVYPEAVGGHWYDGRALAKPRWRSDDTADVAFFRALVTTLVQQGRADPRRVYVTGPSNGGMMTLRLVCDAADLIAAAAAIIANLPVDLAARCKPARPVPVLIMNGTADPLLPYAGGEVGLRRERGRVISTDATLALLRQVNGCTGAARTERLPDLDGRDGSDVTIERWTDCSSGAPVVLYRVEGGGHRIPRRDETARPVIDRLLGRPNRDFEAAEAIWDFFKVFTR